MENRVFEEYKDQIDEGEIRQTVALLKLEPLAYTDPNDQETLEELVEIALFMCKTADAPLSKAEPLKLLALAIEQWGRETTMQEWFRHIMIDKSISPEERINELYRAKIFQDVGPDAIDFSTYCILRYNRRNPDNTYENEDIHVASLVGLNIAQSHDVIDLTNSYYCVEMVLVCGDDYIKNPDFKPMREFFLNAELTSTQKVDESYEWLTENIEQLIG